LGNTLLKLLIKQLLFARRESAGGEVIFVGLTLSKNVLGISVQLSLPFNGLIAYECASPKKAPAKQGAGWDVCCRAEQIAPGGTKVALAEVVDELLHVVHFIASCATAAAAAAGSLAARATAWCIAVNLIKRCVSGGCPRTENRRRWRGRIRPKQGLD